MSPKPVRSRSAAQAAFTLIELVVVLLIISVVGTLTAIRMGTFSYWADEAVVRKVAETISFLHHQAVTDQAFYRMEFNLEKNSYRIGVVRPDEDVSRDEDLAALAAEAGNLSLELAAFLNPVVGDSQTMIPPPNYPSLAEPVTLPEGTRFSEIRTPRGKVNRPEEEAAPFLLFSPRGFTEFGVIHLTLNSGAEVTILINPFTGTTELYREYRDFEFSYGKKKRGSQES